MTRIISKKVIKERRNWIKKIELYEGKFATNFELLEKELQNELSGESISQLLDHLRLCGNIPESQGHDSSQEKQYSKYTDALLAYAFKEIGLKSNVISSRSDVADVEGYGKKFSFVADAKAFRLSRTAKNQKDFKVQAMDRWKHGKPYAIIVCPIYQLPNRNSQIYQQAITRDVCIFTFSHLSLLVRYADEASKSKAEELLFRIFKTVSTLNPSKSAVDYWLAINKTILGHSKKIKELWIDEKLAAIESIEVAKNEALSYLALERERIMRLTYEDAIKELIRASNIDRKINIIKKIKDNGLFEVN